VVTPLAAHVSRQVAELIEKVRAECAGKRKSLTTTDSDAGGKRVKVDDFFNSADDGAEAHEAPRPSMDEGTHSMDDDDTREALQSQVGGRRHWEGDTVRENVPALPPVAGQGLLLGLRFR
jgi:hypothetical protein